MDNNIKMKFDEVMDKFTSSPANTVPKKLNFDFLNDSIKTASNAKKRRYSDLQKQQLSNKIGDELLNNLKDDNYSLTTNDLNNISLVEYSKCNDSRDSLNSTSTMTTASLIPSSPWEVRRMKADLLEANALIIKLKHEIDQQNKIHAQAESFYSNKVDSLIKQCSFSSNKILDLEKHLNAVRKREKETKTENVTMKNQLIQQKQMYEEKLYNLQKQFNEYEDNSRQTENRLQNELSEIKRQNERLHMEWELSKQELENLIQLNQEYQEKVSIYDNLRSELEFEKQEHEKSKSRIKQLEYELSSYGEWKELTKTAQARLINLSDLEKEVTRLRQDNKSLRESIGNKLLLEEQVYDLTSRLEKYEKSNIDLSSLKVQITSLQQELSDWKKIAEDHCPKTSPLTPISLRSRLEQILQKDVILTSEKGMTQNERESFQNKIRELQTQNDIYVKANNDLNQTLDKHKNTTLRFQKKLMIVIKERNCYKQLVENLEKDLTISGAMMEAINPPDAQLKARLDVLEKSLTAYKELCSNLEKELESIKLIPDMPIEQPIYTESYERLKKDIEALRIENDRLRRRKEELELEMEQRCLKGDFNIERYKIVHMTNNPAKEAFDKHQNEIEKLQADIERLKRKIRKLEDERDEYSARLNETTGTTNNMTVNIKEINILKQKLESTESKMSHMKEIYKSASLEFRDVCYMLFGYRVDRIGNANYRISSMYAETEDEYLNFRLNESGVLDMLETDYSISLGNMVKQHLATHKSLPAFLSTLTLELFNKTTIMVV